MMFEDLLEARFKMRLHHEMQTVEGYALVVGKKAARK
jgi:uncharacterized protein (TIGR03435 family)